MAFACLQGGRHKPERTHDDAHVSPFHDQANPQFGIIGNPGADTAYRTVEPSPQQALAAPAPGTAADRRARILRALKGAHARASSEPPMLMGPPPEDEVHAEHAVAPAGHREDDNSVYEWSVERLDTLDADVYVNIASKIHRVEWQLGMLDNKVARLSGYQAYNDAHALRRTRYNMGALSSPSSSREATSPGFTSPAGPTEEYTIGTPPYRGAQRHRVP